MQDPKLVQKAAEIQKLAHQIKMDLFNRGHKTAHYLTLLDLLICAGNAFCQNTNLVVPPPSDRRRMLSPPGGTEVEYMTFDRGKDIFQFSHITHAAVVGGQMQQSRVNEMPDVTVPTTFYMSYLSILQQTAKFLASAPAELRKKCSQLHGMLLSAWGEIPGQPWILSAKPTTSYEPLADDRLRVKSPAHPFQLDFDVPAGTKVFVPGAGYSAIKNWWDSDPRIQWPAMVLNEINDFACETLEQYFALTRNSSVTSLGGSCEKVKLTDRSISLVICSAVHAAGIEVLTKLFENIIPSLTQDAKIVISIPAQSHEPGAASYNELDNALRSLGYAVILKRSTTFNSASRDSKAITDTPWDLSPIKLLEILKTPTMQTTLIFGVYRRRDTLG